jgi:AcrR family transcriptional regulator
VAPTKEQTSKEEKFHAVSVALASLLNTVGPNKITLSQVAKKAKVSRAWIYKYIGAENEDLIRFAIEHIGREVTQKDLNEVVNSKEELVQSITRGIGRMFQNTAEYPWLIPVYYKYRGTDTAPGKLIDAVEQAYVNRQAQQIKKHFNSYSAEQAMIASEILTATRMGLAFTWQRGELNKKASKDQVLASLEHWLKELFNA